MKFYNRETELKILRDAEKKSSQKSQMTFIVGRRRIGKTRLIKEAFDNNKLIYFFVAKKSERLLCEEYTKIIEDKTGKKIIGTLKTFKEIFEYLLQLSENTQLNIAIDEFQEFYNINPSIYSDMQNLWDSYKDRSKLNLVLSGSIYSLMTKIFEERKEPLYGRADKKIILTAFDIKTLKQIYSDYTTFNPYDFLCFYAITGGLAKYIELLCNEKAFNLKKILDVVFCDGSFFLNEGKDLLIEEFGRDYNVYFSILSLIAGSKTSRSEIEGTLEKSVGGYLDKLENQYKLIKRLVPAFSKKGTKNVKYVIDDNFLNFWFMFVYKNSSAIELKNFDYVKKITVNNFDTFIGRALEKYFKDKLAQSGDFSYIGSYWDNKGENEIDIVALNEMERKAIIAEVKIKKDKLNLNILKKKAERIKDFLKGYNIEYASYELEDV